MSKFATILLALALGSACLADSFRPKASTRWSAATRPSSIAPTPPAPSTRPASRTPNPSIYESRITLTADTQIDSLVLTKLNQLQIKPANVCSDAVFVRRVYLDVIGTLPDEDEARKFITDTSPSKRSALIEKLLKRDEFADYWAMKWCDLLRVKAEFPINLWPNAVQAYHKWIHTRIDHNTPYDQFVRDLLTASGSNFRVPPANFYRAVQNKTPAGLAQAVALTFMGTHSEHWSSPRQEQFAAFFSQVAYKNTQEWKEEIVYFDPSKPRGPAVFPDSTEPVIKPGQDPREVLADWLTSPKNPYFARAMANRAWYWLVGRGIVHEPDDFRDDNPPGNPQLLDYLERELVTSKFDVKHLFRLILNSKTYQLSSIAKSSSPAAEANFASYPLRRLDAEVLIDAICKITGTHEKYSSPIPEPFTFIPEEQRSIELADASVTSSFLELFGRSPRDTGLESERANRFSANQSLHMLNSSHIQKKLDSSKKLQDLMPKNARLDKDIINRVYLSVLSRYPTDSEVRAAEDYTHTKGVWGIQSMLDLVWALMNSSEFLYRH